MAIMIKSWYIRIEMTYGTPSTQIILMGAPSGHDGILLPGRDPKVLLPPLRRQGKQVFTAHVIYYLSRRSSPIFIEYKMDKASWTLL